MKPGDVISYLDMCTVEKVNLQRGMNYHLGKGYSVILMSLRSNAPYTDSIEENGQILVYEGYDVAKTPDNPIPKVVDQPVHNPGGSLTENGLFYEAAEGFKAGKFAPGLVKVYEEIHAGIWVFNGFFRLIDAWFEQSGTRKVFKFKLRLDETATSDNKATTQDFALSRERLIPSGVKLVVWKRDKGVCVLCRSRDNLHFDHIIPYSKGGSSLVAENIQLLCSRHNLNKRDKIE